MNLLCNRHSSNLSTCNLCFTVGRWGEVYILPRRNVRLEGVKGPLEGTAGKVAEMGLTPCLGPVRPTVPDDVCTLRLHCFPWTQRDDGTLLGPRRAHSGVNPPSPRLSLSLLTSSSASGGTCVFPITWPWPLALGFLWGGFHKGRDSDLVG